MLDAGCWMLDAGSKILIVIMIMIVTSLPHLPHPCSSVVYFPCLFIPNSQIQIRTLGCISSPPL